MSKSLQRFVGTWTTEATHPAMPGVVVHGTATFEWLEGEHFLIQRARTDHPDFPDSISIIGSFDRARADQEKGKSLCMHYYDSRGVFRDYSASIDGDALRFSREDPEFPQRFYGTFTEEGNTMNGVWQLRREERWEDDLKITYRRKT